MNNQELAALCRIEISRWQSVPDKQYMVDLLELALAALTAEPVKVPDELTTDGIISMHECGVVEGWNSCIAEALRLNNRSVEE